VTEQEELVYLRKELANRIHIELHATERARKLRNTVETAAKWLVCYTLTTPEDLFQSAPEMYETLNRALEEA
jgi:hypothetical protein